MFLSKVNSCNLCIIIGYYVKTYALAVIQKQAICFFATVTFAACYDKCNRNCKSLQFPVVYGCMLVVISEQGQHENYCNIYLWQILKPHKSKTDKSWQHRF